MGILATLNQAMAVRSFFGNPRVEPPKPIAGEPVVIARKTNDAWSRFNRKRSVTIVPAKVFSRRDRFFTIGSCFAEEVRKALTARGVICLPEYRRIAFDSATAAVDKLPAVEHLNFFNTYSIRQEIERVAGVWTQDADDLWEIPGRIIADGAIKPGEGTLWQDPYRRLAFGTSKEILNACIASINSVMADGMRQATAFVITLGLTEVFVKKDNGLVACQVPGYGSGGGDQTTTFLASSYEENLANMDRAIILLRQLNPDARVVLTVSPVALRRTFSGDDIVVANQRSKAILLAVAHEICRRYSQCLYFPSYEIATVAGREAFQPRDGRHVEPAFVEKIMDGFIEAHLAD
jgi:hypothetical protein